MSRAQTKYSYATHAAAAANKNWSNNFICKNGAASTYKLAYGIGTPSQKMPNPDGVTVLRLLPHLEQTGDPSNPTAWVPYRTSMEANHYGDWIRRYRAVRGFGEDQDRCTFIVADPVQEGLSPDTKYPSDVLYDAINSAVRAGQGLGEWTPLILPPANKQAALKKSESVTLVKAVIVYLNGKLHNNPPLGITNLPIVMELTNSASKALLGALERPISDAVREQRLAAHETNPYELHFENGDPIALDRGRFFTFYKNGDGSPSTRRAAQTQVAAQPVFGMGGGSNFGGAQSANGFDANSYACEVSDNFQGLPANFLCDPAWYQLIERSQKDWDSILQFPSIEEQVEMVATRFPWSAIEYAFANNPLWMRHARAATGRTEQVQGFTAPDPGMGFGGQGFAPPPFTPQPAYLPQQGMPQYGAPNTFMPPAGPAAPQQFNPQMTSYNPPAPVQQNTAPITSGGPSYANLYPERTAPIQGQFAPQPIPQPASPPPTAAAPAVNTVSPGIAGATFPALAGNTPGSAVPQTPYQQGAFGTQQANAFNTPSPGFAPPAAMSRGQQALQLAAANAAAQAAAADGADGPPF